MIKIRYVFSLQEKGEKKVFEVNLDPQTLDIVQENKLTPDWTQLGFYKCNVCPLDSARHPHCPVAVNIASVAETFANIVSCERAEVTVETEERRVCKETQIADGLYSLLGIYMASSGCPMLEKLKPMVRFHLPFASIDETAYRAVTMYLAAQYFRMKKGLKPDWELTGLTHIYEGVRDVNICFTERLRNASKQDSMLNSIVNLDMFAIMLSVPTLSNDLEYLFAPYFKEGAQTAK